jgi:hypothetical protein
MKPRSGQIDCLRGCGLFVLGPHYIVAFGLLTIAVTQQCYELSHTFEHAFTTPSPRLHHAFITPALTAGHAVVASDKLIR